jgi:hypothetical protein
MKLKINKKLPDALTWILLVLISIFLHFFEIHIYGSTHWLRVSEARTLMCIGGLSAFVALPLLWLLFAPVKRWYIRILIAFLVVFLHGVFHPTY